MVAVLLHCKLYLTLNWYIQHCRALTNTRLWIYIYIIPTGIRQKVECLGKPGSFENQIENKKLCFETCQILGIYLSEV